MNVPFLIIAFVVTISSAQYTDPICPIEEDAWCATRCNVMVDEPICALQDGIQITLRNQCVLNSFNCKCQSSPLEFLHEGECYPDPICPIEEDAWCATRCNVMVDEPICALQDGIQITLRNQCVLNSFNCKCQSSPLEVLHDGECLIDPVCPIEEEPWCAVKCNIMVYAPICVSQGGCKGTPITLRNQCVLSGYKCQCKSYPLEFLYEGVC